jgi:AcrR family transcriptional regulator
MSSETADTRTKVLQATLHVLESAPEKMPRMSDIAKAAGISRQALYLHFESRTDLLIEATRYQDRLLDVDTHLAPSRKASSGAERLDAFVMAWCTYIPKIWSVGRALLTLGATEPEAQAAIDQRMADVREGFEAAVRALEAEGALPPGLDTRRATDLLSMLMSFRNWEMLTQDCGWSQAQFGLAMQALAKAALLGDESAVLTALGRDD